MIFWQGGKNPPCFLPIVTEFIMEKLKNSTDLKLLDEVALICEDRDR